MTECFHPRVRADIARDLMGHAPNWSAMQQGAGVLRDAGDNDFVQRPATGRRAELGSTIAELDLGEDHFAAVESGGSWYVVDTGL